MHCPVLKTLVVAAFLGDNRHKVAVVRCRCNLDSSTQLLWTAESQVSYLKAYEPWLYSLCPSASLHSKSTLFEWQFEVNSSFANRYSQKLLQGTCQLVCQLPSSPPVTSEL